MHNNCICKLATTKSSENHSIAAIVTSVTPVTPVKLLKKFCKSKITNIGSGKWLDRKEKEKLFCPNFSDLIVNCCDIQCIVSYAKIYSKCERCYDYGESSIDNLKTWKTHSHIERTQYQYQVPLATQPQLASTNGQRIERVMKGMHRKG